MTALDFIARGRAAQQRSSARRLATIGNLARSIERNAQTGLPGVMSSPPIIGSVPGDSLPTISGGKDYGFNAGDAASDSRHRFSFYGGPWAHSGTSGAHPYIMSAPLPPVHLGDGSDPTAGATIGQAMNVRFYTEAAEFEIYFATASGFRVLVNGEFIKAGTFGNYTDLGIAVGQSRYQKITFPATGPKFVELQFDGSAIYFKGIRVPALYDVQPWPHPEPLRICNWGDSFVETISEDGASAAELRAEAHGSSTLLMQMMTGQPDIWASGVGGTGFAADGSGTRSDFIERAPVDISPYGFDVLFDTGGRNDDLTQAEMEALAAEFIDICLASNPDMIIAMTGPCPRGSGEAYSANASFAAAQDGKRAACARYPANCLFIETLGNAEIDDPWFFGTGRQGDEASDGNADLFTGADGIHRTLAGHRHFTTRLLRETARRLPLLASRIRDGVIAGVNDTDIA